MLPVEHMDRLYTTLKAKGGQVSIVKLHAGHMDAYETASQVQTSLRSAAQQLSVVKVADAWPALYEQAFLTRTSLPCCKRCFVVTSATIIIGASNSSCTELYVTVKSTGLATVLSSAF